MFEIFSQSMMHIDFGDSDFPKIIRKYNYHPFFTTCLWLLSFHWFKTFHFNFAALLVTLSFRKIIVLHGFNQRMICYNGWKRKKENCNLSFFAVFSLLLLGNAAWADMFYYIFWSFCYRLYNERRWSSLHVALVKWQQAEIEDFTENKLVTWSKNSVEIFATTFESCDLLMKFEKLIIVVMEEDVFQRQAMNFLFNERFPNPKIIFFKSFNIFIIFNFSNEC